MASWLASQAERDGLLEIGRIVRLTLDAMEQHVRPGITTIALDDVATAVFRERGARSAPALVYGFPATVLISVNDETIEPIIGSGRAVQSPDGWTIRTRDGSLAAHQEHTLVVTSGSPLLLTAAQLDSGSTRRV